MGKENVFFSSEKNKANQYKQKTQNKADLSPNTSVVKIYVKRLNSPVKSQRF